MDKLKEKIREYKNKEQELLKLKSDLFNYANKNNISLNENTLEIDTKDEIYVFDVFMFAETRYENPRHHVAYGELIEIPNDVIEEIRPYITKNKDDWEKLLCNEYFLTNDKFENFRRTQSFLPMEYIESENIQNIFLREDYSHIDNREGILDILGEMCFGYDYCFGYITILKMDKDIFNKNKYKNTFEHSKYFTDNCGFKYETIRCFVN